MSMRTITRRLKPYSLKTQQSYPNISLKLSSINKPTKGKSVIKFSCQSINSDDYIPRSLSVKSQLPHQPYAKYPSKLHKQSTNGKKNIKKTSQNNPHLVKVSLTDRNLQSEDINSKNTVRRHYQQQSKLQTIDNEIQLSNNQQVIKSCIEQLQGVLKSMHKQKHKKRRLLTYRDDTHQEQVSQEQLNQEQLKNKQIGNKFQNYVNRIRNRKNQHLNNKKSNRNQNINEIQQTLQVATNNNQQVIEKGFKTIYQCNQVECSSIDDVNQSSFLSQLDRNVFQDVWRRDDKQKISKCFRKIKGNFPPDFF